MLVIIGIIVIILIFGPQTWVRHVLKKYNAQIEKLDGTGGELATHLIEKLGLNGISVELSASEASNYNPKNKIISLTPDVYNGKSLTAISISAHLIGHSIQHLIRYKPFLIRSHMEKYLQASEKAASIALISFPLITLITHLPTVGVLILVLGISLLLISVVFHLVTLPIELDASFQRALPILVNGKYISKTTVPIMKKLLLASSLTYLSKSLASILNFYQWISILRR